MNSPFQLNVKSLMNSRLSTLFSPVTTPNSNNLFNYSDLINTALINNGKGLNKIGRFEPSDITNIATSNTSSYNTLRANSYQCSMMKYNNSAILQNKSSVLFQGESKLLNYNNNVNEEVNSSKLKTSILSSSELQNNEIDFTKIKRRRFITTSKLKTSKIPYQSVNYYNDEGKENKFKIEANKMTKRLIEENILNKNNNSFFTKISHNNNNELLINNPNDNPQEDSKPLNLKKYIFFDDIKTSSINYSYLLSPFSEEPDNSFNFYDPQVFSNYKNFHIHTVQNEKSVSLNFGQDPLLKFEEWLKWLSQEKEKEKNTQSNQLCDDIAATLNSITTIMSSFPIFMFPGRQPVPNINPSLSVLFKYKKKKEEEENCSSDKKFYCDFCSETFASGQGLGGHMSRKHKNQSLKFKHKKEIRNKREPLRKILHQAKKKLCINHLLDFDEQMRSKQGKKLIRKLILEFNEEYKKIKNEMKRNFFNLYNKDQSSSDIYINSL